MKKGQKKKKITMTKKAPIVTYETHQIKNRSVKNGPFCFMFPIWLVGFLKISFSMVRGQVVSYFDCDSDLIISVPFPLKICDLKKKRVIDPPTYGPTD